MRAYLGHIGHIAICRICKICRSMSQHTKLHIEHIWTYFLSYFAYCFAYFLSYPAYFRVIFFILFVIFCIFSCIFSGIFCILKQIGQGQFLQCSAKLESVVSRLRRFNWSCNPQEAGSGSIRAAAAQSSVTGNRCWSSLSGTQAGRHCCRASIGALLTTGKHVVLPSIHQWDLMELLQDMQNVKMQNVHSVKNMLNMLKI